MKCIRQTQSPIYESEINRVEFISFACSCNMFLIPLTYVVELTFYVALLYTGDPKTIVIMKHISKSETVHINIGVLCSISFVNL